MVARKQRLDELDPVVKEERDAIARPHTAGREHGGQTRGAIVELSMSADVSPKITAGRSGRDRHARPVSSGSTSRRDCSSADGMRVVLQAAEAPSAATPATASMRAVKNSAIVGSRSVWSGRYQCQMLL